MSTLNYESCHPNNIFTLKDVKPEQTFSRRLFDGQSTVWLWRGSRESREGGGHPQFKKGFLLRSPPFFSFPRREAPTGIWTRCRGQERAGVPKRVGNAHRRMRLPSIRHSRGRQLTFPRRNRCWLVSYETWGGVVLAIQLSRTGKPRGFRTKSRGGGHHVLKTIRNLLKSRLLSMGLKAFRSPDPAPGIRRWRPRQ